MRLCKNCGKQIGFSLTGFCNECWNKRCVAATLERHREELRVFEEGKGTVVVTDGHIDKEDLITYAERYGYEVHGISNDNDPDVPISL